MKRAKRRSRCLNENAVKHRVFVLEVLPECYYYQWEMGNGGGQGFTTEARRHGAGGRQNFTRRERRGRRQRSKHDGTTNTTTDLNTTIAADHGDSGPPERRNRRRGNHGDTGKGEGKR